MYVSDLGLSHAYAWLPTAPAISNARHLVALAREIIDGCWNAWQTKVPRWLRWAAYGALLGLGVYLILGFGIPGVAAGMYNSAHERSIHSC